MYFISQDVPAETITTFPHTLSTLDLTKMSYAEAVSPCAVPREFALRMRRKPLCDSSNNSNNASWRLDALCLSFTVRFKAGAASCDLRAPGGKSGILPRAPEVLSTAPDRRSTHWRQTVLLLKVRIELFLSGLFVFCNVSRKLLLKSRFIYTALLEKKRYISLF